MCGILLHYSDKIANYDEETFGNDKLFKSLVPIIRDRGNDYENYKNILNNKIELYSSVLSLRQPLVEQPLIDNRFVIQFNGELYNDEILSNMNDVEFLHSKLKLNNNNIIKTIGQLIGEFAYSIIDKLENKIYFGKDIIGRKSLTYSLDLNNELYISSCPPFDNKFKLNFIECKNASIYCYNLNEKNLNILSFDDDINLPKSFKVLNDFKEDINIEKLHKQLSKSVYKRISTIFPLKDETNNSKFAILFSGGIDCTIIAGLCGEICENGTIIDLLNVSFSNPRANLNYDETPDRKLAIENCNELNKKYNIKGIQFKLIKINVSFEDYNKARENVINLIYPNNTEMDLSIAIAFYFASSGKSNIDNNDSKCKVLLSGLGADELFGGYTRHERIFTGISNQIKRKLKNKPINDNTIYDLKELNIELRDELQIDLDRLWERNLTRDDKVISCWSKEVRYPFLDENFIKWVTTEGNVPLNWKLNFNQLNGEIIRKKALRELAEKSLGLSFVANEPKRAIQFGSKSAKMEIGSGKVKGTDKLV